MSETKIRDRFVGIYSFPKSGNTWLRAIIAALTDMPRGPGMMQKYLTDTHFGRVMEHSWEFQGRNWYFYKSHHKNVLREHMGETLPTDQVIYIYRHPLDVFVSYLNFVSRNVSPRAGENLPIHFDSVEDLTPDQLEELFAIFLEHTTLFPQNKTFGGVFEHVNCFRSLRERGGNVHMLRYEDLTDNFDVEVQKICDVLEFVDVDIHRAFRVADRRTQQNGKFFWKRQKENFRNYLTEDQIARFMAAHKDDMEALGYPTS